MNYELAKQLKDAGFPVIWENDYYTPEGMIFRSNSSRPIQGNEIFIPILSELIEACGDDFKELKKIGGRFFAMSEKHAGYSKRENGTPEEAVAKLWLELNKKQ